MIHKRVSVDAAEESFCQ